MELIWKESVFIHNHKHSQNRHLRTSPSLSSHDEATLDLVVEVRAGKQTIHMENKLQPTLPW